MFVVLWAVLVVVAVLMLLLAVDCSSCMMLGRVGVGDGSLAGANENASSSVCLVGVALLLRL